MAKKEGFDYLFCPITHYEYNSRNYYIMPKINGVGRADDNHAWHYMTEKESTWCADHGLCDLHSDNFGFRKGKLCIVDYACTFGYESGDIDESFSS